MTSRPLKERLATGEPCFGAWLGIASSYAAEIVSHQGFDYVCVDLQHGLIDYAAAAEMLLAIHAAGSVPWVRVPANDFAAIGRALDAGALGIVVPLVETPDDIHEAVSASRYPPAGARSFGPHRAAWVAGPDYALHANEEVLCIPMIETRAALEALDDILAVPGIDAVYVGPNDLSLALGMPPAADNPDPYQTAYRRIAEACARAGIPAGIHANADLAGKHVETGYRLITVTSDSGALARGVARDLRTAREAAGRVPGRSGGG